MKLHIILFCLLSFSWGCSGGEKEVPDRNDEQEVAPDRNDEHDVVDDEKETVTRDTGICIAICGSIGWVGGEGGDAIYRGMKRGSTPVNHLDVIDELNDMWETDVQRGLALANPTLRNDTLMLDLENAHIFTQRMGTTGAMITKALIVYSLTEDPNVKHVALRYEEGDHGGPPGVFERDDVDDDLTIVADPECACQASEPIGSEDAGESEGGLMTIAAEHDIEVERGDTYVVRDDYRFGHDRIVSDALFDAAIADADFTTYAPADYRGMIVSVNGESTFVSASDEHVMPLETSPYDDSIMVLQEADREVYILFGKTRYCHGARCSGIICQVIRRAEEEISITSVKTEVCDETSLRRLIRERYDRTRRIAIPTATENCIDNASEEIKSWLAFD